MRFSTISTVLAIVGSASVLAVPVLDTVGDAGGLGSPGGTGDLSVILEELAAGGLSGSGGDLGGLGGLKRTTPQPEYVGSPQVDTSNSCNVGMAQCCQSIHQTSDFKSQSSLGALLGAAIPLDDLMVGVQCSPIANMLSIAGSNTCSSQPVCCSGNTYSGLINLGCSPISL